MRLVLVSVARGRLLAPGIDRAACSGYHPPSTEGDRDSGRQILLRARNAALLINSFAAAGVVPFFDHVVVRWSHLNFYRQMVKATPFHVVVLAPSLEVALRRDRQREKHVAELWEHLDAVLREDLKGEGVWIDSYDLTIDETVDAIMDIVGSRTHLTSDPERYQSSRTLRSPTSTLRRRSDGKRPTGPPRSTLSTVTRAVTLTTESRGSPEAEAGTKTLPGMAASLVFDVMTATRAVASRLLLKESAWIAKTGRRLAGRLPAASPKSTQ